MKRVHEKVDKSLAPVQGTTYVFSNEHGPLFTAEVTKYKGGCWAGITVKEAATSEMQSVYKPGDSFDIKVANYSYEPNETAS